ncbi:hypothetical protein J4443_00780 [Candidatus Woesearchaeota archaeon]|nr:hypothetical protein [Candidatus Woesearchaeota archaeon]
MLDLVKFIKGLEREFLEGNKELYDSDRLEFLRKRDEFVSERLGSHRRNGEGE